MVNRGEEAIVQVTGTEGKVLVQLRRSQRVSPVLLPLTLNRVGVGATAHLGASCLIGLAHDTATVPPRCPARAMHDQN